jgi:DNA repair exonuclease SbcCD ATPase subunit
MGEERPAEAVATDLPADLATWLEERAAANGVDRAEFLSRLAAAYRQVEGDGDLTDLPTRSEVEEVETTLANLQADFDEKVADVRDRVVQVKREADAKAPSDHTHESLDERLEDLNSRIGTAQEVEDDLEDLQRQVADMGGRLEGLEADLAGVEDRTEAGFKNYETVLEDLLDRAERLEGRLETLARTTSALKGTLSDLRGRAESRAQVGALKREANRMGISAADCEACGTGLEVALLTEPACPACGEDFAGVQRRANFLRSHTLTTGTPPALEAGAADHVEIGEDVLDDGPAGGST